MRVEEFFGMGSRETPKVGDKCTIHFYSDSHACQVVKVSPSGKTMWIRKNVVTVDPSSTREMGHQDWIIHENEFEKVLQNFKTLKEYGKPTLADEPDNFSFFKVTKRKNGNWRTCGSDNYVSLGLWHEYYDWSF